jgi:hypothetical protein
MFSNFKISLFPVLENFNPNQTIIYIYVFPSIRILNGLELNNNNNL